jgi:hypothetical protein
VTLNVQVSVKKSDGTIYVVGGENPDEFAANLMGTLQDQEVVDAIFADMLHSFTPASAGASPAPAGGYYTPPAASSGGFVQPGAERTSQVAVAVKIPWAQKAQADPYLAPLKTTRQATWDAANKQWILAPGVDLTPFAAWLPPGA